MAVQRHQGGGGVVQLHFCSAAAVLGAVATAAYASGAAFYQKEGGFAIQLGGHQKGVGLVAHGHHALVALQLVAAVGRLCCGFAGVERIARTLLLVGQHDECLAAADAGQPGSFGGGVGVVGNHRTGNERLVERLEHDAAAQLFHHHHAFGRAHAQAAIVFGHIEAAQAELGQFIPGSAVKAACFFGGAATVEAVALVHPFAHGVAQLFLVVRKIEIHGLVLEMGCAISRARIAKRCCVALRCCRRKSWFCAY